MKYRTLYFNFAYLYGTSSEYKRHQFILFRKKVNLENDINLLVSRYLSPGTPPPLGSAPLGEDEPSLASPPSISAWQYRVGQIMMRGFCGFLCLIASMGYGELIPRYSL